MNSGLVWGQMGKTRLVQINGVGEVLFLKRKGSKRLSLSLTRDGQIRVTIPFWVSYTEAERLVSSNISWVMRYLEKMGKIKRWHGALDKNNVGVTQKEARKILVGRLEVLAREHGFSYNKVYVRNQRTTWGSCSFKNNISLNIKLVKLSVVLMDYVILHELVHTVVKDHTERFWGCLSTFVENAKAIDTKLKKYQPEFL